MNPSSLISHNAFEPAVYPSPNTELHERFSHLGPRKRTLLHPRRHRQQCVQRVVQHYGQHTDAVRLYRGRDLDDERVAWLERVRANRSAGLAGSIVTP